MDRAHQGCKESGQIVNKKRWQYAMSELKRSNIFVDLQVAKSSDDDVTTPGQVSSLYLEFGNLVISVFPRLKLTYNSFSSIYISYTI